jgi:Fe-S cluster assembly ATPase SufC
MAEYLNSNFAAYVARLKAKHGDKFDGSSLAPQFAEHFGRRVEVEYSYGEKKRGWITGTTGWRPSLMILLRSDSMGSSWLVGEKDKVARVLDYGPRR